MTKERFLFVFTASFFFKLFVSRPGYVFLASDYSQMEMRILASLSNDKQLREFFRRGGDIHKDVFAHWKRKNVSDVTNEERELAKRVVYAILYGMGPAALSHVLKVTKQAAQQFLSSFLSSFPDLSRYMNRVSEVASSSLFINTVSHRRRSFRDADSARHLALNSIVQGSAADVMKQAMVSLFSHIRASGIDCLIVSSVHDEIICEVRNSDLEAASALVKRVMESCTPPELTVPLTVALKTGQTLGTLK